jgi:hypothetical protein
MISAGVTLNSGAGADGSGMIIRLSGFNDDHHTKNRRTSQYNLVEAI